MYGVETMMVEISAFKTEAKLPWRRKAYDQEKPFNVECFAST